MTRTQSQLIIDNLRHALKNNIRKVKKQIGTWDWKNTVLPKTPPPSLVPVYARATAFAPKPTQTQTNDENEPSGSTEERESLYITATEQDGGSCLIVKSNFWAKVNYIYVSLDTHALWDIILLLVLKEAALVGKTFDKDPFGECYVVDR